MTWLQLNEAAEGPEVSSKTIQREMAKRNYSKCKACLVFYQPPNYCEIRYNWAKEKSLTWTSGDWKLVRFSDEAHFGRGPQRQLILIRKPGERGNHDCIQEMNEPNNAKDKNQKRYHVSYGSQ